MTSMLCQVCNNVPANLLPSNVATWWKKHKAADLRRKLEEAKAAEAERQADLKEYRRLQKRLGLGET